MRLKTIDLTDVVPVQRFFADDLGDVVVLAGPNGVGKTRLIQGIMNTIQSGSTTPLNRLVIQATSDDERTSWQQDVIDTSLPNDVARLTTTLHRNRRRSEWRSSVYQIESDRALGTINPYAFSFDTSDPYEEMVGWNYGFGRLRDRFQDTQNAIFRKVYARRQLIAASAEAAMSRGEHVLPLDFPDPLNPFKLAFAQLLAPKALEGADPSDQRLFYRIGADRFPITTLSSGEREVVNIVFDFILRQPADSIVVFDEPELHLHPELSYRLIQTLRTVGERNQFIFVTHSADIITASLDNSVIFVAPPKADHGNQAILVREDDSTNQALKLLGQSIGIVSLGKRLVLIEGSSSSLDKQTYGTILRNRFPDLILVPSGGKGLIRSFAGLVEAVLERTIWGVNFFMLCDRDAIPQDAGKASEMEERASGKLRILSRYHLENYFLDENVLAAAFGEMEADGSWLRDPAQIKARLREIARESVPYATALIVSSSRRERFGNLDMMPDACHDKDADALSVLFLERARAEALRFTDAIDESSIDAEIHSVYQELMASIDSDGEEWRRLIPGKRILSRFASQARLDLGRVKQLYLNASETHEPNPFLDIIKIFEDFARIV